MPVGKTGANLKDFKRIDWDSLTFANNYVFLEVMNNKKRCQYLIERILHIPIKEILQIVTNGILTARGSAVKVSGLMCMWKFRTEQSLIWKCR